MNGFIIIGVLAVAYVIWVLFSGKTHEARGASSCKGDRFYFERREAGPVLALFCLVAGFIVGGMTYGLFCWKPEAPSQHIVQILAVEGFGTLTLFAMLGFIWALFSPRWLERLTRMLIGRFVYAVCVLILLGICLFVCTRY